MICNVECVAGEMMKRKNMKLSNNNNEIKVTVCVCVCHIYLPSSLSVSRFSLLSRSLSVLCVESDRLCVPVVLLVLGSGFRSYSSSLKRDVSPLLNSSEMLRAEKIGKRFFMSCIHQCVKI